MRGFIIQELLVRQRGLPHRSALVTLVCWYNVGGMVHDISGGPWGTSGRIQHGGNFMWKADSPGIFPDRCSYHGTQMLATLTVLA